MIGLNYKLQKLEEENSCIGVGVVGAGQMGGCMVATMVAMKGMKPSILADINLEAAAGAFRRAGVPEDQIAVASTLSECSALLESGKYVITEDSELATKNAYCQCIVDATGVPEVGAKVAVDAINNGKHIVMLNVETDVCIGHILYKQATNAGLVYTGSAGDEPGVVIEMFDFAQALGLDVRVVGKGKNTKINKEATPETVKKQAAQMGCNPHMLCCFVDGTKTMVEMTAMANATGYIPDIDGAHGPKATLAELPDLLSLKSEGGILNRYGIIEYIDGIAPGVFVTVSTEQPDCIAMFGYMRMGKGPNYVLYRPYHLCSLETPLSVAKAVLDHEPTIAPRHGLVAETVTVAKRDLKAGEYLDGIGGYTVYGLFVNAGRAKEKNALPLGLVNRKTKMLADVKKGGIVRHNDVQLDRDSLIVSLRKIQDTLYL